MEMKSCAALEESVLKFVEDTEVCIKNIENVIERISSHGEKKEDKNDWRKERLIEFEILLKNDVQCMFQLQHEALDVLDVEMYWKSAFQKLSDIFEIVSCHYKRIEMEFECLKKNQMLSAISKLEKKIKLLAEAVAVKKISHSFLKSLKNRLECLHILTMRLYTSVCLNRIKDNGEMSKKLTNLEKKFEASFKMYKCFADAIFE